MGNDCLFINTMTGSYYRTYRLGLSTTQCLVWSFMKLTISTGVIPFANISQWRVTWCPVFLCLEIPSTQTNMAAPRDPFWKTWFHVQRPSGTFHVGGRHWPGVWVDHGLLKIWLWVKTNGVPFWGRCTTQFRTYLVVGLGPVHWGYGLWLLTHGPMAVAQKNGTQSGLPW